MNGKRNRFLSLRRGDEKRPHPHGFASTRLNGTSPFPAPSLRELSSEARLRECTSMNVSGQKFQSQYEPVCKPLAWSNHRGTLPQSRPLGVPAPSEREPGMGAYHSTCRSETARLRAIFIVPTKLRGGYISPFNAPLGNRKIAGDFHRPYGGRVPFSRPVGNRNVAGDFHRPYGTRSVLHSTIQPSAKSPRFLLGKRYRVGQGIYRIGTISKRN